MISIFIDIDKRDKDYDEEIKSDLVRIEELGLMRNWKDMQAELAIRLAGEKVEDTGDDQLIGAAIALTESQYKKYM